MTDRLAPMFKAAKALTHALVEAVGGPSVAASLCGHRSPSTLSAAGSPSSSDRWIALDDLIVLERHAQRPIVSAWLARLHEADPDRVRRRRIDERDVLRLAKEGSESKLAIIAAHDRRQADGTFCAADRAAIARELRELGALVADLLDAVEEGA